MRVKIAQNNLKKITLMLSAVQMGKPRRVNYNMVRQLAVTAETRLYELGLPKYMWKGTCAYIHPVNPNRGEFFAASTQVGVVRGVNDWFIFGIDRSSAPFGRSATSTRLELQTGAINWLTTKFREELKTL